MPLTNKALQNCLNQLSGLLAEVKPWQNDNVHHYEGLVSRIISLVNELSELLPVEPLPSWSQVCHQIKQQLAQPDSRGFQAQALKILASINPQPIPKLGQGFNNQYWLRRLWQMLVTHEGQLRTYAGVPRLTMANHLNILLGNLDENISMSGGCAEGIGVRNMIGLANLVTDIIHGKLGLLMPASLEDKVVDVEVVSALAESLEALNITFDNQLYQAQQQSLLLAYNASLGLGGPDQKQGRQSGAVAGDAAPRPDQTAKSATERKAAAPNVPAAPTAETKSDNAATTPTPSSV